MSMKSDVVKRSQILSMALAVIAVMFLLSDTVATFRFLVFLILIERLLTLIIDMNSMRDNRSLVLGLLGFITLVCCHLIWTLHYDGNESSFTFYLLALLATPVIRGAQGIKHLHDIAPFIGFDDALEKAVYAFYSPVLCVGYILWCINGSHSLLMLQIGLLLLEVVSRHAIPLCLLCWQSDWCWKLRFRRSSSDPV